MQVFELHFNPDSKKDIIFDTFYYEPEDVYEKRLGHLFLAGELTNVLFQNTRFLKNLARAIKSKFYSLKTNRPETALKKTLQEGNDFLGNLAKDGDVSWISHLNFAILNLSPRASSSGQKGGAEKYKLNFTKIGDIKIFLARAGKALDIGQNLDSQKIEPYPLKVFFDIVSGKVERGDRILVMTKTMAETFLSQGIVEKIAKPAFLDDKELNKILADTEKNISGACLLISLDMGRERELERKLIFKEKSSPYIAIGKMIAGYSAKTKEIFKRSQAFLSLAKAKIAVLVGIVSKPIRKIKPSTFLSKKRPTKKRPEKYFTLKQFSLVTQKIVGIKKWLGAVRFRLKRKNVILILSFVFFLFLGGLLAKIDENKEITQLRAELRVIREKINEGEALIVLDQQEKANALFVAVFEELQSLEKTGGPLKEEVLEISHMVEAKLLDLNKLEKVEAPELFFEFPVYIESSELGREKPFLPQKLIYSSQKIYCFSSYSENLYELDISGGARTLKTTAGLNYAAELDDGAILFLSRPNHFSLFKDGQFEKSFELTPPFDGFEFENLASFKSSLYFLDSKTGEIVKYPYIGDGSWGSPQTWLERETPRQNKISDRGVLAIDGKLWVLQSDDSINIYYGGKLQDKFEIKIFPKIVGFTKILVSPTLSYLYILEPGEKRIIILDKSFTNIAAGDKQAKILKQYQSEAFDNLKDFAISEDGKKIYLLSGQKLYQIKVD